MVRRESILSFPLIIIHGVSWEEKNIEHVQAELCQAQVELGLPAISLSITLKLFLPVERLQNAPKHEVVFLSENVKAVFPLVENNLYINKDIC